MVERQVRLPCLGHPDGDAGRRGEVCQGRGRVGVHHPAPGDDDRALRLGDQGGGAAQRGPVGPRSRNVPGTGPEELSREVEGLGLDVLRQGEGDRSGVGRAGQIAHRLQQCGRQLLGPVDAVEEHRDGPERVVGRDVAGVAVLLLLQHSSGTARGEDVTGQAEDRDAVHGRGGSSGHHVGRARPDRRGHGQRPEPVRHLGVPGGHVDRPLLVARLVEPEIVAILQQGLADAGHVAMTEDADCSTEEVVLDVVALDVLGVEELDDRLAYGQALGTPHVAGHDGVSFLSPVRTGSGSGEMCQARAGCFGTIGSLGSIPAVGQASRTADRHGSSLACSVRFGAGPARMLR